MVSEETLQQIDDFFSDELSDTDKSELLSKVESSEEVRARFEESRKLWSYMDSAESIEPEPDYIRKFWKEVSEEEEKNSKSFFPFNFMNKRLAFATSLAVFLLLSTIMVNNFILEEEKTGYVYDADDELLINNLEEALSLNSHHGLNVYGPWEDTEN